MLVFAMVIMFLSFLGLGIKFSRWGKNSLGGVKIHQVGTSETVNTYWTRPSPTSSLLHPDKVILGEAKHYFVRVQ